MKSFAQFTQEASETTDEEGTLRRGLMKVSDLQAALEDFKDKEIEVRLDSPEQWAVSFKFLGPQRPLRGDI
jgi:hypothetical protein